MMERKTCLGVWGCESVFVSLCLLCVNEYVSECVCV